MNLYFHGPALPANFTPGALHAVVVPNLAPNGTIPSAAAQLSADPPAYGVWDGRWHAVSRLVLPSRARERAPASLGARGCDSTRDLYMILYMCVHG